MNTLQKHAASAMDFDALDFAERITGESYKENDAVTSLGFLLNYHNGQFKKRILGGLGDTTFGCDFDAYVPIAHRMGFETVLADTFLRPANEKFPEQIPAQSERVAVLFHPDGLLLYLETYADKSVNQAKMYAAFERAEKDGWCNATSSGQWVEENVWRGDWDVREGLGVKIAKVREVGRFLNPWPAGAHLFGICPHDYGETGDMCGRVAETTRKSVEFWQRLPAHVKACTGDVGAVVAERAACRR